jgi:hypothetical protein
MKQAYFSTIITARIEYGIKSTTNTAIKGITYTSLGSSLKQCVSGKHDASLLIKKSLYLSLNIEWTQVDNRSARALTVISMTRI